MEKVQCFLKETLRKSEVHFPSLLVMGSPISSVTLRSNIPNSIQQSFYPGQVNVTFKESVFQLSSSFRSVLEIQKALIFNGFNSQNTPHLYLMTNGGREHQVNFESVKIPLILIFKQLKLDSLIAISTAPGQSYVNIVECIMSILNIGVSKCCVRKRRVGI